jgi:hypothetical protein
MMSSASDAIQRSDIYDVVDVGIGISGVRMVPSSASSTTPTSKSSRGFLRRPFGRPPGEDLPYPHPPRSSRVPHRQIGFGQSPFFSAVGRISPGIFCLKIRKQLTTRNHLTFQLFCPRRRAALRSSRARRSPGEHLDRHRCVADRRSVIPDKFKDKFEDGQSEWGVTVHCHMTASRSRQSAERRLRLRHGVLERLRKHFKKGSRTATLPTQRRPEQQLH